MVSRKELSQQSAISVHNRDFDYDEEEYQDTQIRWSNLIFLPFHPISRLIVLFTVVIKSTFGPLQAVFPAVYCTDSEYSIFLTIIKYYYSYCCDTVYGFDMFLHILHRQVTTEALRREYLPKSEFLLLLDLIVLVPFFRLFMTEICPSVQMWPNILSFIEFATIYRVVEYFSVVSTHSITNLSLGLITLMAICINCITCFFLLMTYNGLCAKCKHATYDWRLYVSHKLNETDINYTTYVYGASYVLSFTVNKLMDTTKPTTLVEFVVTIILMVFGYFVFTFFFLPKMFAEALLRLRRICEFLPLVQRIIEETRRRNPNRQAHISVENFYTLMWKKRSGITCIPEVITELPRYLRLEIRLDLVWQVFYHSPTFRQTSRPFKSWLCDYIRLDYKLPDEKFFEGPHAHTHLYYIKSGIVQILSSDDGTIPLLSLTSGTMLGDISYYVPSFGRKVSVCCLTYCEVFYISRADIIKALYKFPEDRRQIIKQSKLKMKHARTLYTCKQHIRGLDRTEDEGISWVKRRWWEISDCVMTWKKLLTQKEAVSLELPPEEAVYHCAKYIGQLVLCNDAQLHRKSMFANAQFPWILTPESNFGLVWHRIVVITVYQVLLFYPPLISRAKVPEWFFLLQNWTDFVYIADICVKLFTAIIRQDNVQTSFSVVMFSRFKSCSFFLDIMAALWLESLAVVIGRPELYYLCQYNRLIKIYILFSNEYKSDIDVKRNPLPSILFTIILVHFCYSYIFGFFFLIMEKNIENLTTSYWLGEKSCNKTMLNQTCDPGFGDIFAMSFAWTFEMLFTEYSPNTLMDIYFGAVLYVISFLLLLIFKGTLVAAFYLRAKEATEYQFFVSNIRKHYKTYKIHPDLLIRLNRYLICHWKYYKGMDVMHPNVLKNEPYDIFWHAHGEVAVKIIGESRAFLGADPALIREIAYKSKFLILPRSTTIILFGVQCKNVTWLTQGCIKCEYHNERGELQKILNSPGQMLSLSSVFLGTASLRTYTTHTECETLYIKRSDFFKIIRQYPTEWSYLKKCIHEFDSVFKKMLAEYVTKHKHYQENLRRRVFHAHASVSPIDTKVTPALHHQTPHDASFFVIDPEQKFVKYWCLFRAIVVFLSIMSSSLQGSTGSDANNVLVITGAFCDAIALFDIGLKAFLGFYNKDGILVCSVKKCLVHYLTRGFILDVAGALPWSHLIKHLPSQGLTYDEMLLLNTFFKFFHLYLLVGYFNYLADSPSIKSIYLKIIKWQLVIVLATFGASQYFVTKCIEIIEQGSDVIIKRKSECWLPKYIEVDEIPTTAQLRAILGNSLIMAQCGLHRINLGMFDVKRDNVGECLLLFLLGVCHWYVVCYTVTLLCLCKRGNTIFRHGVSQLRKFLQAERVDETIVNRVLSHFRYWWIRTGGINLQHLMDERIGVVFRQDLSYYFYKCTFGALDTILQGGEQLQRKLASSTTIFYFMQNEMVMRELDLTPYVHIVHRGTVVISKDSTKLATLTKGAIFGQLTGVKPRPVQISAAVETHADVLQLSIKVFQELIDDEVRARLCSYPDAENDFINVKEPIREDPYNTITYLLRRRKAVQLPWMKTILEANTGTWYASWLIVSWVVSPVVSAFLVLAINTFPLEAKIDCLPLLILLDIVHFFDMVCEFYKIQLAVIDGECVNRRVGLSLLKQWTFYATMCSFILPAMTLFTGNWFYQMGRLIRLRLLYEFHKHFCRSFRTKATPAVMNIIYIALIVHAMTCFWMYIACCNPNGFPIPVPPLTPEVNETVNYDEWVSPNTRNGRGCARLTRSYNMVQNGPKIFSYVVPKNWKNDYIVAITYIIVMYTHTDMDAVIPLTPDQAFFKVLITFIISLISMWVMSLTLGAAYLKLRELYQYDYNILNLNTYLKQAGLSPTVLNTVKEYTKQLWQRQSGNWLPELAHQTSVCLREDILAALYLHHLEAPPLFRELPPYFTRQLVTRLHRVVIFPGKYIVQQGDIFPCVYFIHEGEVEKWHTDSSGETKMLTYLSTCGYFGLIPGLFPNWPHSFSYVARTVVDLVYLRFRDWQDLLDGYPIIKENLYVAAEQLKNKDSHRRPS